MIPTYLVLGLARSGTSLCAGLLDILGVEIDDSIGAPDKYAPGGYFESAEVCRINRKIFKLAWDGRQDYPDTPAAFFWHPPSFDDILKHAYKVESEIEQFIRSKAGQSAWGFKKPATCLTLNLYLKYIEHPRWIIVERGFEENVSACALVYNLDRKYVSSILNYYKSMLNLFIKHYKPEHITIHYEALKGNHTGVLKKIADFCNIDLTLEMRARVDNFVDPNQFGLEKYAFTGRQKPEND